MHAAQYQHHHIHARQRLCQVLLVWISQENRRHFSSVRVIHAQGPMNLLCIISSLRTSSTILLDLCVSSMHKRQSYARELSQCRSIHVDALPADDGSVRRLLPEHCRVERGEWWCLEPAIARCWRSRKATVPKEVLCGARPHRGCPSHDFRACRSSHCQVLALPLTHSPEGGSQWCQITPHDFPGVCGCTCDWSMLRSHRCNVGGCCVAVARTSRACRPYPSRGGRQVACTALVGKDVPYRVQRHRSE